MDYISKLHELCEAVFREIGDANEKIRSKGGVMSAGDVEYLDKLTHTLKSIKATIAMMEDEEGYSNRSYDGGSYMGSYRGGSYRGGSYSRRRDSMGRYSRTGDMAGRLYDLMQEAPNDSVRMEIERLAEKIEQQR